MQYLVIFLLSFPMSHAAWQTYQNDLRNSGAANGTGYLPLNTANFSIDIGMEFQPLVDDLDANGKNEIILFSNSSLIVLNPQLEMLSSVKIGRVLGQPTLFNFDNDNHIEIVFNARQNSTDYFFAYEYNSGIMQEFNLSLAHDAEFAGIRCFGFNGTNYCVFKDKLNYVNIIDMNSKIGSFYNTSAHEESRQTVPAIGDIDNDGNLEAVFWFNQDNSSGYGFMVFDLSKRELDKSFNSSGIVDNIFSPTRLGPSLFHQLFELKGQPVLVDLNNDNRLEIAASVFYDDSNNQFTGDNWFTELFVYSSNGTKLFSKCELNPLNNVWCGTSMELIKWEGTNPFVLDYDKNGYDDICFIKDDKQGQFVMNLNCYNYSGSEIANIGLSKFADGIQGNAIAADMNNDGAKEIITRTNIYLLNGTSIFFYNLDEFNPVPVDIDGNNGLDLIWSHGNLTKIFLDNNSYTIDLAVDASDISFFKFNDTHVNISVIVHNSGQAEANKVKVIVYNTETLDSNTAVFDIRRRQSIAFSSIIGLTENQEVLVSADYLSEITESDENNNDAVKEFLGLPYVFVSAESQSLAVRTQFKDYIRKKLTSGYYTENEAQSDVKVYIGKL